jgi:hypothetical protein
MKKFYLFLVMTIGMISLQSCTREEIIQNNNIEVQVIELTNVNFTPQNDFRRRFLFNPPILNNDMLLVYRLDGVTSNGNDIWRQMPQVYFEPVGGVVQEIEYNFDFTINDVDIFMLSTTNVANLPTDWTQNQVFRVVILPGYRVRSAAQVNFNDFEAVVNAYNLDLSKMKKVSM